MRILEILAQDSTWCRDQDVRKDYLRINNMATDHVNLFIIDFACKPKSESDFYYFNTFDIARLE